MITRGSTKPQVNVDINFKIKRDLTVRSLPAEGVKEMQKTREQEREKGDK